MNHKPLIYLAGPGVFRKDARQYSDDLKRQCRAFGFEGLWPCDIAIDDATPLQRAHALYRHARSQIDQASAIIADISPFRGPNMDPGTAFEIGYAVATGTPVFAWSPDLQPLHQKTLRALDGCICCENGEMRDANGDLIENFTLPENLMIACSVRSISSSFHEALLAVASELSPLKKMVG